jgi:hypothetical protein
MSSNIDYGKPPWQPTYMCSTLENFKVTVNQMDKVKHTIIIVSFYFNFMNLMKFPEETVDSCIIYTEDYWLVCQSHFVLVNFLTIQVFAKRKQHICTGSIYRESHRSNEQLRLLHSGQNQKKTF